MVADDWTEKYRPASLSDVLGNPGATKTMRDWAESWKKGIPKHRALVIYGSPGIGKTSAALALAKDMGWNTIEMNASDQRTASAIENVAGRASQFNSFNADGSFECIKDGKMKLIILDEADCLYGNADRGAAPAILQLIRTTHQPIILICNDFYELCRKSSAIKTETEQITFKKPQAGTIAKALMSMCAKERAHVEPDAIAIIAENANGDMRAAVRDLQSLTIGKEIVTADMADALTERESRSDMFRFTSTLLQKRNANLARQVLRECDSEPSTAAIWIEENLPSHCVNKQELADSFDMLSRADVYLGRVSRRMYYGFWSYANDIMIDGIADSLKTPTNTFTRINFPKYLSLMSKSRSTRATRREAANRLCTVTHTSANRVLNESIDFFKFMCKVDQDFCVMLVKEHGMTSEELAYLLDCKPADKQLKAIMDIAYPPEPKQKKSTSKSKKEKEPDVQAETSASAGKATAENPDAASDTESAQSASAKQKSLFDF